MALTREQILASPDADSIPLESVDCPEWGGTVLLRTMSGAEREVWNEKCRKHGGDTTSRAAFVVMLAVNEDRSQLFTLDDIATLSKKSSVPLDRICNKGMQINGLLPESVEDLEKNLGRGQSENSGLSSLSPSVDVL